ncbi:hypothetical protein ABT083_23150 [Streptomyces goshikiensis]|uniref:hypothetical protein n=1 Tax=Streptomyces goshikiensis TaxID=1942 RepID=UPI003328A39D
MATPPGSPSATTRTPSTWPPKPTTRSCTAIALRGLAVQCVDLGYRAEAVRLGDACVDYGRHLDNPRAVAYCQATLANAAAQDDDRRMATKHLAMSETAIGKPTVAGGDSWAAHYSPGCWADESGMILSSLGDLDAAEDHSTWSWTSTASTDAALTPLSSPTSAASASAKATSTEPWSLGATSSTAPTACAP